MNREMQDLAWKCLPKEARDEVKVMFNMTSKYDYPDCVRRMLINLYGNNLTSDTEPEEMLMVERKKVQQKWKRAYEQESLYSKVQDSPLAREELYYNRGIMSIIDSFFSDKCLSDKEPLKIDCADDLEAMFKDELPDLKKKYRFEVGDVVVYHPFKSDSFYDAEVIEIKEGADKPYALKLNGAENIWAYPIEVQSIEETYPSDKEPQPKSDTVLEALEKYRKTATPEQKSADLAKLESECLSDKEEQLPLKITAANSLIAMAKSEMKQVKPKFEVGDKVLCKAHEVDIESICVVLSYNSKAKEYKLLCGNSAIIYRKEDDINPYVEREYKAGDRIKIVEGRYKTLIGTIKEYSEDDDTWAIIFDGYDYPIHFDEELIEPYAEENPIVSTDETIEETKETKETMEEKELNLCELLNSGDKVYNILNNCEVDVIDIKRHTIYIDKFTECDGSTTALYKNGSLYPNGITIIYPSRAFYEKYPLEPAKAWAEWAESKKSKYVLQIKFNPYKDDKYLMSKNEEIEVPISSLEEAEQIADGVREYLQKFHERKMRNEN